MTAPLPIITLVGCGKMGSAMLRGWIAAKIAQRIYVVETYGLPEDLIGIPGVEHVESTRDSDIIVLAVKPQMMDEACQYIEPGRAAVLSIAAGQKIANFEKHFGRETPIIRAMPNTPAAIGQGITVAVTNATVTDKQKDIADSLLQSMGKVEWIENEALMDAVTALSGSGPAYVFYLIELLARAGEQAGLTPHFAMSLARQTVIGSAALAGHDADTPVDILRENVTSPGGTTEAALDILMDGRVQSLFTQALAAATARSKELSA